MSDLVERLRRQLTMSMFATKDDLYGQLHDERVQAADRIEQLERVLLQARGAMETCIETSMIGHEIVQHFDAPAIDVAIFAIDYALK